MEGEELDGKEFVSRDAPHCFHILAVGDTSCVRSHHGR